MAQIVTVKKVSDLSSVQSFDPSDTLLTERTGQLLRIDQDAVGETGKTPVLSIGSVTTLDEGQAARIEMDDTDPLHPILHFYIPKGSDSRVTFHTDLPMPATESGSAGLSANVSRGDHSHPKQMDVAGNAGSATKLETARNIGNAPFDGTQSISVLDIGAKPLDWKPEFNDVATTLLINEWETGESAAGEQTLSVVGLSKDDTVWVDLDASRVTPENLGIITESWLAVDRVRVEEEAIVAECYSILPLADIPIIVRYFVA